MSFCASETRVWVLQVRSRLQSCFQHLERRCVLSAHMLKLRFLLCVFKRSCQTWVSELRVVFGFCVMFVCFHFVFWVFGWCVGWESFDHVFLTQTASFHHCTFEKDIFIQNEGFFLVTAGAVYFFTLKRYCGWKSVCFLDSPQLLCWFWRFWPPTRPSRRLFILHLSVWSYFRRSRTSFMNRFEMICSLTR